LMANILENPLHRYQEAFNAYQKLLQTYPNSYYAARSRDRMKLLREEKLIEIP
jgi:outer membrane protein assembly factor BamD (BamD/ComL family)